MHRDGLLRLSFLKNLHCFLWVHVHRFHEPTWRICANRNHAEVHGAQTFTDFLKHGTITAVSRMPEFFAVSLDAPTAPVSAIAIKEGSRRKVLSGCRGDMKVVDEDAVPPRQFLHLGESLAHEPGFVSFRDDDFCVAGKGAQRRQVAVVVMSVREQNEINDRQFLQSKGWRNFAFECREVKRKRGAMVRKDRVDKYVLTVTAQKKRSMTQPYNMPLAWWRTWPSLW